MRLIAIFACAVTLCLGVSPRSLSTSTGSSTFMTFSMNATLMQTSTPATRPMMAAPVVLTNPLGAVIATRPASKPLPLIEASGFPLRIHM